MSLPGVVMMRERCDVQSLLCGKCGAPMHLLRRFHSSHDDALASIAQVMTPPVLNCYILLLCWSHVIGICDNCMQQNMVSF